MTNTPMSDLDPKVKELLEAARHVVDTGERNGLYRLGDAIAAFDPPKPEKEYTMPEWGEFIKGREVGMTPISQWVVIDGATINIHAYCAIREALSKPKAPTE